jgi:hypothetical protein
VAKYAAYRQQNADGTISIFYSDGSFVRVDPYTGAVKEQDDSPNPMRAAMFAAGDTTGGAESVQRASEEDRNRFDEQQQRTKEGLALQGQGQAQNYKLGMYNAQTSRQSAEDQAQAVRDRLAWDRENGQANLGLNLLKTGVDYHNNPADWFNEAEWSRGVAARPDTSTFLSALQNNTRLPGFTARGAPAEVASIDGLTAKLTGNGPADNSGNYLAQIGNIGAQGAQRLGAGSLEQLTDTERKLFTGGLAKLGYDPNTFLQGYARSRVGQSFGAGRSA